MNWKERYNWSPDSKSWASATWLDKLFYVAVIVAWLSLFELLITYGTQP